LEKFNESKECGTQMSVVESLKKSISYGGMEKFFEDILSGE